VYASTGVMRNAIPFLLLPVLTRRLTAADLGMVATFEVILAVAFVCVNLNLHGAVAVNYFILTREDLERYVGSVLQLSLVSFVLTFVVAQVVLQTVLGDEAASLISWAPGMVVAALAQSVFSITLTLWQVEQRPVPYGVFQILQTLLNVALSLTFVIAFGWGWRGRLWGIIIASIAFGLAALLVLYRRNCIKLRFDRAHARDALWFGVPLVPHALGVWILAGVDRLFLTSMLSVAATGVYAVGYQFGMIVGLVATSFNQAWSPFLFEKLREGNPMTMRRIVQFTYAYNVAIIGLALAVSAIAPWFLRLFVGEAFQESHKYVFWVSLGYAANGMYFMVANYIFYEKKTHLLAFVTFTAAVCNVILNYLWIPAHGALGAAQATAASFLISFLLTWILSARVHKMPWLLWKHADIQQLHSATRSTPS